MYDGKIGRTLFVKRVESTMIYIIFKLLKIIRMILYYLCINLGTETLLRLYETGRTSIRVKLLPLKATFLTIIISTFSRRVKCHKPYKDTSVQLNLGLI